MTVPNKSRTWLFYFISALFLFIVSASLLISISNIMSKSTYLLGSALSSHALTNEDMSNASKAGTLASLAKTLSYFFLISSVACVITFILTMSKTVKYFKNSVDQTENANQVELFKWLSLGFGILSITPIGLIYSPVLSIVFQSKSAKFKVSKAGSVLGLIGAAIQCIIMIIFIIMMNVSFARNL